MIPVNVSVDADSFMEAAKVLADILRMQGRPDIVPWAFVIGGFAEIASERVGESGPCRGSLHTGTLHLAFDARGPAGGATVHVCDIPAPKR